MRWLILAPLLSLLACGAEERQPGDTSPNVGLSDAPMALRRGLLIDRVGDVGSEMTRVASYEVTPSAGEVTGVDGTAVQPVPQSEPWSEDLWGGVLLTGTGPTLSVDLALSALPASFDAVRVRLGALERTQVAVGLLRDGEVVALSQRAIVENQGRAAYGRFDFTSVPDPLVEIDGVRVLFAAKGAVGSTVGACAVQAVDLDQSPLLWGLPAPEATSRVTSDGCSLEGVAISGEVHGRIRIPEPLRGLEGAQLHFSFSVPPEFAPFDGRIDLEVRAGSKVLHVASIAAGGWTDHDLPLPDAEEVTIHLLGAEPGRRVGLLGNARAVRGTGGARTVLLISSDTHRYDHLGCSPGSAGARTPELDALAARGTRFDDCWSTTNVTTPSHVALLTGLHPAASTVIDNRIGVTPAVQSLAEVFSSAGFETEAFISVPHLRDDVSGLAQGFERYHETRTRDLDLSDRLPALEASLERTAGRDRFLWLHLFDAHAPYDPPPAFQVDEPAPIDEAPLPEWARPTWEPETTSAWELAARYRGEVEYLDDALGRVLAHPSLAGAVIAFTADHGESLGGHGIWFDHQGLYPDTLHVPLILAGPGVPEGAVRSERVQQASVAATLSTLVLGSDAGLPGEDLLGEPGEGPRYALSSGARQAAVELDGDLLVLDLAGGPERRGLPDRPKHGHRLFHLARDPGCVVDVARVEPLRALKLRRLLIDWLRSAPRTGLARAGDVSEADEAQLAALGYGSGASAPQGQAWFPETCHCEECIRLR